MSPLKNQRISEILAYAIMTPLRSMLIICIVCLWLQTGALIRSPNAIFLKRLNSGTFKSLSTLSSTNFLSSTEAEGKIDLLYDSEW